MEYFDMIKERLEPKLKGKELTDGMAFKDLGIDSLDLDVYKRQIHLLQM